MKKRTILGALLLAAMLVMPFTAKAQQYLVLTQSDGSTAEFALADNPVITLEDGNLVVTCGERQISTSLEGTSYAFSDTSTDIREVQNDSQPQSEVAFGQVAFSGLKAGNRIVVYTIDGRQMTFRRSLGRRSCHHRPERSATRYLCGEGPWKDYQG